MRTVEQIVGSVFNVDGERLDDASGQKMIPSWDSMGHLTLIMELEKSFGLNIAIPDAMQMVDVGAIKRTLRKYGVKDLG